MLSWLGLTFLTFAFEIGQLLGKFQNPYSWYNAWTWNIVKNPYITIVNKTEYYAQNSNETNLCK